MSLWFGSSLRSKLENSGELPNRDTSGTVAMYPLGRLGAMARTHLSTVPSPDLANGKMSIRTMNWEKLG